MAAKFGAKNTQKIVDDAKRSFAKQELTTVKMIDNADLIDNPANSEDVSYTADLEASIQAIGFVDPLDVTPLDNGKYMIVSGHRRRATGVKLGMDVFPCLVHNFASKDDMENWLLYLNNYRDTAKDPLLFMRRALSTKAYLERTNFDGSIRNEIARRLGLSTKQADRYLALAKIITPIHVWVSDESVSVSSVHPLASHTPEEQAEIYDIMKVAKESGTDLTRDVVKRIVDAYRAGRKSWAAVLEYHGTEAKENDLANGLFANSTVPEHDTISYDDESASNRNDEIRREHDEIAEEYDKMDADEEEFTHGEENDIADFDTATSKRQKEVTEIDQSEKVIKALKTLNDSVNEIYSFSSESDAKNAVLVMNATICQLLDEMHDIIENYNVGAQTAKRYGGQILDKLTENDFVFDPFNKHA